jgi:hypothetical protein
MNSKNKNQLKYLIIIHNNNIKNKNLMKIIKFIIKIYNNKILV